MTTPLLNRLYADFPEKFREKDPMSLATNIVREIIVHAIPQSSGQFEYQLVSSVHVELGPDGSPNRQMPLPPNVAIAHLGDFVGRLASQSVVEQVEEQKTAILVPGGRR